MSLHLLGLVAAVHINNTTAALLQLHSASDSLATNGALQIRFVLYCIV